MGGVLRGKRIATLFEPEVSRGRIVVNGEL